MLEKLYALEDLEYKKLVSKLTPNISMDSIIGVRIPEIRKLAKEKGALGIHRKGKPQGLRHPPPPPHGHPAPSPRQGRPRPDHRGI